MSAASVNSRTRYLIGGQVAIAVVLALGAALLAIDLTDSRFLRFDLSEGAQNTLDPAIVDQIERLPDKATVDVFFRPLAAPYGRISHEAQGRMLELLVIAANAHRDRLELRVHRMADVARVKARQNELGVQGVNLVVFSSGERRAVSHLFGEIADVDWGNPTPQGLRDLQEQGIQPIADLRAYNPYAQDVSEARLRGFRGGEVLAAGLAKVSSGTAPVAVFTVGHGEPGVEGHEESDLLFLRQLLESDGFRVMEWDLSKGPLPDETSVLVVVGLRQPLRSEELESVRRFVRAGGRLIAAPSFEEIETGMENGVTTLLSEYGIRTVPGVVCQPYTDGFGKSVEGHENCVFLTVGESGLAASHPLTEPLRRRGLRVSFSWTHSFERAGAVVGGGTLIPIIYSPSDSWLDLPDAAGLYDYTFEKAHEVRRTRFPLAMAVEPVGAAMGPDLAPPRVLALASSHFFSNALFAYNRDFLLSAFNWMSEREHRIGVAPRTRAERRLDVYRSSAGPALSWILGGVFPLSLVAVGLGFAWRRRRG